MALSMYACSIPALIRNLNNLSAILAKGAAHARDNEVDETVFTSARLYPDMFTMARQVQIACDVSKNAAMRLSGVEAPSYEDTETTFEQLQARIANVIKFLESVPADKVDGTEEKTITLKAGPNEYTFSGQAFVQTFVLPNVYFHVTTAYNILRHNGVKVGKMDFLGGA